jgi:hypothetical protein
MPLVKTLFTPLTHGEVPKGRFSVPGRYVRSWAYKDDEDRYFYGIFPATKLAPHKSDTLYLLEAGDVARPDLISYKHYGTPVYYWALLWLNGIVDPFEQMYAGMLIRIPTVQRLAEYGIKG